MGVPHEPPEAQDVRASDLLQTHPSGKKYIPMPRGPHSVGYVDVMTEGDPSVGTFFRLYYPTNENSMDQHERWPRWIYEDTYISGTLNFLKAVSYRWPSWAPKEEYQNHALVMKLTKLTPRWGFKKGFKQLLGNIYTPIIENAPIKSDESHSKWPVVVFSHGLGCNRFMYSQVCYDMASYGFIVAATEHRDGSGCLSYYLESSKDNDGNLSSKKVRHCKVKRDENEYELRNKQVHHRAKEVTRTLDLLLQMNNGEDVHNVFKKRKQSKQDDFLVNLSQFKNLMNFSSPVISGHSFGGATTVLTLMHDKRFKIGMALDAWLFPLRDENILLNDDIPILFINTEKFLNSRNLKKMSLLKHKGNGEDKKSGERTFFWIRGSVHQNQLDMPFLLKNDIVKKHLGAYSKTCPETVMNINNKLMAQFLFKELGLDHPSNAALNEELQKYSHLTVKDLGLNENTHTTEW